MSFAEWFWFLEMERITHVGVGNPFAGATYQKNPLVTPKNKSHIKSSVWEHGGSLLD